MNIVIYARFSSHKQHETSIEGQLKECYAYARRNGYTVIGEYKDSALSGTSDNRPEFKRMISDSAKKQFQLVLVYQLDRFARSRLDSATYKAILKRNGVRVVSARENITDDASGILMESVLEGMAEYYSAELGQKVKRGMRLNAEKCLYTGGGVLLGYKVNPDKTFSVDEDMAYYVRKIFEMYASGNTVTEINRFLNSQNIKTIRGAEFNKNSLHGILKNKRYIGIYTYKDMEIPDGFPRIISDDLFYKVQKIMETNKKAHAHLRKDADAEFILTTKLFCGKCHEMMTGSSGTSKTGKTYRYYICTHAKKKLCDKKTVGKDFIEDLVVKKCRELLTDENIEVIAKAVVEVAERDIEHSNVTRLEKLIADNERAVGNLMKALEAGEIVEQITARIREKNQEKAELQRQLAEESALHIQLTVPQVKFFLTQLRDGKADNIEYRKTLVTVLVNAIYLYDDKVTFILNVGDKPVEVTEELLEDIENNAGVLPLKGKVHQLKLNRIQVLLSFSIVILGALMKKSEFPEKAFETYINHFLLEEGFDLYMPSQAKEAKLAYDALINNLKSKDGRIMPIAFQYKIVSKYAVQRKAKNFKFDLHAKIVDIKPKKLAKYTQHNILYNKNKSSKYFAAGYVVPYFVTNEELYENIDKDTLLENSYFIRSQQQIPDGEYVYHYCTFDKNYALQHSSEPFNNEIISLKELLKQIDNLGRDYAEPIESFIAEFASTFEFCNLNNTQEFSEEQSRNVYPIIAYKLL